MSRNNTGCAIVALVMSTLVGCAQHRTKTYVDANKTAPAAMSARFLDAPNNWATLPVGVYPLYCLKLGAAKRARVIGVDPGTGYGWPTAKPVPLRGGTNSTPCLATYPISTGDQLEIKPSTSPAAKFTLAFKHTDQAGTTTTITKDLFDPPGLPPGVFPMWYQTSDDKSANAFQYFVYFLDADYNEPGKKIQRYYLEAFDLSASQACLDERPSFAAMNVEPVASAADCDVSDFQQNGTGTGEEPK